MPISFPFPVRVSVGLVVAGVEQLRKLPGDLPTLGVTAAGQAMRLSMRVQQEFADLAIRGDEVLSLIGGQPAEHPAWATFDEEDADPAGAVTTVAAAVQDAEDAAIEDEDEDGYSGDATQELAEVIALDLVAMAQSAHRAQADEPDAGPQIDADAENFAVDAANDGDASDDDASDDDASDDEGTAGEGTAELQVEVDVTSRPLLGTTDNGAVDSPDDYDSLTLAELRGRLRRLSADQVTDLLGRERAGADRPAFVTLLSNRLTSMEQGHP
jgi:hypothetical protein